MQFWFVCGSIAESKHWRHFLLNAKMMTVRYMLDVFNPGGWVGDKKIDKLFTPDLLLIFV